MRENFTPIPNSYLEGKARYRNLTQEEGSVLMIIERETFGFGRTWAKLTLSYLADKTGMDKPHLCRAMKSLKVKNLIAQSGNREREYSIQADPELWGKNPSLPRKAKPVASSGNIHCPTGQSPNRNNKETFKETCKETTLPPVPPEAGRVSEVYPPQFLEFWEAYPRKEEKAGAFRCFQALLKAKHQPDDLLKAARNYSAQCRIRGSEPRYIKLPATFLGRDKPFLEWVNSPPPALDLSRQVSDFSRAPDGYWQGGVFIPFKPKEEN